VFGDEKDGVNECLCLLHVVSRSSCKTYTTRAVVDAGVVDKDSELILASTAIPVAVRTATIMTTVAAIAMVVPCGASVKDPKSKGILDSKIS
jgi:hypothetical protein